MLPCCFDADCGGCGDIMQSVVAIVCFDGINVAAVCFDADSGCYGVVRL